MACHVVGKILSCRVQKEIDDDQYFEAFGILDGANNAFHLMNRGLQQPRNDLRDSITAFCNSFCATWVENDVMGRALGYFCSMHVCKMNNEVDAVLSSLMKKDRRLRYSQGRLTTGRRRDPAKFVSGFRQGHEDHIRKYPGYLKTCTDGICKVCGTAKLLQYYVRK